MFKIPTGTLDTIHVYEQHKICQNTASKRKAIGPDR